MDEKIMGMTGIDEESALLKKVRADLSVNRKNLDANEQSEASLAQAYGKLAFLHA